MPEFLTAALAIIFVVAAFLIGVAFVTMPLWLSIAWMKILESSTPPGADDAD